MSAVVELLGGPADGHQVSLRVREDFIWIDVRSRIRYARPGRHRVLYRKDHYAVSGRLVPGPDGVEAVVDFRRWIYVYAGHTHALCRGCGGFHERVDGHVDVCSLCGGRLAIP